MWSLSHPYPVLMFRVWMYGKARSGTAGHISRFLRPADSYPSDDIPWIALTYFLSYIFIMLILPGPCALRNPAQCRRLAAVEMPAQDRSRIARSEEGMRLGGRRVADLLFSSPSRLPGLPLVTLPRRIRRNVPTHGRWNKWKSLIPRLKKRMEG